MLIEKKHIDEKTEMELTVDKYNVFNLLIYTTDNASAPIIDNSNIVVNRDYSNEHAARRAMARYTKKLSEV